jgi:hypothetical protein
LQGSQPAAHSLRWAQDWIAIVGVPDVGKYRWFPSLTVCSQEPEQAILQERKPMLGLSVPKRLADALRPGSTRSRLGTTLQIPDLLVDEPGKLFKPNRSSRTRPVQERVPQCGKIF